MKTLKELLRNTPVTALHGDDSAAVAGLVYDSRAVGPGDCFFAVRGTQNDGHDFIPAAVAKGAAAVVCERLPEQTAADVVYVAVPDAAGALADMAAAFYDHPSRALKLVGITGTNGKTSTTEMTSEMLTACGLAAPAVGNIGKAVSHAAVDPANDVLCVELSSFQLHFTYSLELDCAAITNIADDHLDWHGGIENYAADKAKVFHNVKKALVYNADDERVTKLAFAAQTAPECRRIGFTLAEPKDGQIGVKDGWIVDMSGIAGGEAGKPFQVAKVTDFTHLTEPDGTVYPHLLADALTALALVLGLGADKDKALAALKQFTPGGHRIQTVAVAKTSDGGTIRFVDDSKATNAHAAKASLDSFADKSVVWIAGGLAKGSRFEQLVADQAHTIKAAIIIGKDQQPMLDAFKASAPDIPMSIIDPTDNDTVMARAIDAAGTYAQSGDVVLMAPACASMDQFKSYANRGNQFAQQAQRWVNEHGEA